MKRVILFFVAFVFGIISTTAQSATPIPDGCPNECKAFCPEYLVTTSVLKELELNTLFAKGSKYGQDKHVVNPRHWDVYSDRSENTTYKDCYGKVPFGKLDFNERVRIAVIKGDYALVYTENRASTPYPQISSSKKWRGWIPMQNLLLWRTCPADKNGIYQKALICQNLDEAGGGDVIGKRFNNPKNLKNGDALSSSMDFFFIMKKEGSMHLLASVHSMDGISDGVLIGWVHKQSFVSWNQRSCLEPNWNKSDYEDLSAEEYRICFYDDSKKSRDPGSYWDFNIPENKEWRDIEDYRWPAYWLRLPLLDHSTTDMYNISTFAPAGDSKAMASAYGEQAEQRMRQEQVTKDLSHINIGIVIDGTKSMGEFYKPVAAAVKQCIKDYFGKDKRTVRVGAVIYRDHGDGARGLVEGRPFVKPDNKEFWSFFEQGGDYGIKSANDKDYEEALYYGINYAIDFLKFNPEQSNFLLVIGDCGNRVNDKSSSIRQDDIIKKLVDRNIQVMTFQVRDRHDNPALSDYYPYEIFRQQMMAIQAKSIQGIYKSFMGDVDGFNVRMLPNTDKYYVARNTFNDKMFTGLLCFPNDEQGSGVMMPEEISKNIEMVFERSAASVNNQIMAINQSSAIAGSELKVASGMTMNQAFYENRVGGGTKGSGNASFRGYADIMRSGHEVFQPVIFISADELTVLVDKLSKVNRGAIARNPNDRDTFIEAVQSLIVSQVDGSSDIGNKSIEDIQNIFFGLNGKVNRGRVRDTQYSLKQLADPDVVDAQAFNAIVRDFTDGCRRLQMILESYDYKFSHNGLIYYWIPVKDLPF